MEQARSDRQILLVSHRPPMVLAAGIPGILLAGHSLRVGFNAGVVIGVLAALYLGSRIPHSMWVRHVSSHPYAGGTRAGHREPCHARPALGVDEIAVFSGLTTIAALLCALAPGSGIPVAVVAMLAVVVTTLALFPRRTLSPPA